MWQICLSIFGVLCFVGLALWGACLFDLWVWITTPREDEYDA